MTTKPKGSEVEFEASSETCAKPTPGVDRPFVSYSTSLGRPPTAEELAAIQSHYRRFSKMEAVEEIDSSCQATAEEMALLPDDFVDIDFLDRVYRERLAEKNAPLRDIAKNVFWDSEWERKKRLEEFCLRWQRESAKDGQKLKRDES